MNYTFTFPPMKDYELEECVRKIIETLFDTANEDVWYNQIEDEGGWSWAWYKASPPKGMNLDNAQKTIFMTNDVFETPFAGMYRGFSPKVYTPNPFPQKLIPDPLSQTKGIFRRLIDWAKD